MTSTKKTLREFSAILTVFFNECSNAISQGWVGPVLKNLKTSGGYFTLDEDQSSWIASLWHLGSIIGAILSALLLDIVGRKFLIICCSFIHLISWFTILITHSIPVLYLARLAVGLAIGIGGGAHSVYLGEISSPKNRSRMGFTINLFFNTGFLIAFTVATYSAYHTTALFISILQVFFAISTLLIVEPPQFLLMKNKFQRAEKNFLWLKGLKNLNDDVKEELEKIKNNAYTEVTKKSSHFKLFKYPANYRSLLIIIFFSLLKGLIGYFPITSFAPVIFSSTKVLTISELFIILGVFKILWAMFLVYIVNRFNRRSILLFACIVSLFSHTFIAILYYMKERSNTEIQYFPWLIFIFITFFMAAYSIVHITTILIRGELFPLSMKPLGNCISIMCYSASGFLSTKLFLFITTSYGIYVNFLIFTTSSLILTLFTYFCIPETRNKSLIEIQELLENKFKPIVIVRSQIKYDQ